MKQSEKAGNVNEALLPPDKNKNIFIVDRDVLDVVTAWELMALEHFSNTKKRFPCMLKEELPRPSPKLQDMPHSRIESRRRGWGGVQYHLMYSTLELLNFTWHGGHRLIEWKESQLLLNGHACRSSSTIQLMERNKQQPPGDGGHIPHWVRCHKEAL